ncbi:MAG: energy transducer TonB [Acidobacteria bacterium]|nr:energy transducer TonB [Acidobacteriota bacterium]MBW4045054.1 energy transducer TonB [Acidobacteriota bacterium]
MDKVALQPEFAHRMQEQLHEQQDGLLEFMVSNNLPDRDTFGLLPEPEGRFGSFTVSAIVNAVVLALLVLFTMAQLHKARVKKYETTQLIFPVTQPKPYTPPVPKVKFTPSPIPAKLLQPTPRQIEMPKPVPEPPKVVEIKTPTPAMPVIAPAPPKAVAPPPQPKVGMFKSATPTLVANNHSAPSPKTGGFGDPVGVTPNPNANRPATVASVGAFNSAPGIGSGAGAARKGSVKGTDFGAGVAHGVPGGTSHGTVASAGFANGVIGGTPGSHGTGRVANTGFGTPAAGPAPAVARQQSAPATSIIVLSKPLPQYTAEAKQLRIQGDVTLEVRFTAGGQVEVLRVINGLGHGLDEQAKLAAERIRFKPAMRDGHPVDQVSIIHVSFQLA